MTHTLNAARHPFEASPLGTSLVWLTAPIAELVNTVLTASILTDMKEARRARRDYQHLSELPDYLLEDVGLSRADVAEARRR
ncbi:DUF1127 domain-containing protein [Tepidamorphus sp. 3E244]|uniref:DUF1127 domain-containing protein n=1 Tax=Tepidamorphus sp. 3E244 TaxID=3385498 RepID=UPI0038FC8AE1